MIAICKSDGVVSNDKITYNVLCKNKTKMMIMTGWSWWYDDDHSRNNDTTDDDSNKNNNYQVLK